MIMFHVHVCKNAIASVKNFDKPQLVLSKDPVLQYQVGTKKMKTSRYQVSVLVVPSTPVNPVLAALAS